MRKLLLTLLIAGMMFSSAVISASASAQAAKQALDDSFPFENGWYVYPECFAGAWIEGAFLRIALTSDETDTINGFRELLREYEVFVTYTTEGYAYSLRLLEDTMESMHGALKTQGFPITYAYVEEQTNRIILEFREPYDEAEIEAAIAALVADSEVDAETFVIIRFTSREAPPEHNENPGRGGAALGGDNSSGANTNTNTTSASSESDGSGTLITVIISVLVVGGIIAMLIVAARKHEE
jgi:hypothetical protein